MHFIKTFVPLLLASLAASAPLAKRSLLTDIASVSSDVATLTSAVTSFDGGLFQALALLVDFDNLKSAIDTATTAADASAALDTTDSTTLTAAVTALIPKILAVIADIEAKESVASSSGYETDVLSALNTLRNHSGLLFTALIAIADTADAATLTTYSAQVYDALTTAIADY
ncbi:hypothetical protein NA56DRAFT_652126 [Hyaloscypha hepaticicola]|uniref:Hydrophobic surface binding protein A n=1 Tax=Hyaloscypha hepaticicola TaxID=2082293 RepID=A0A2J6PFY6_9HELO|nr:hypothetical protein NA56DRAFT_652126 [Hyaloscypha hepaticicola]